MRIWPALLAMLLAGGGRAADTARLRFLDAVPKTVETVFLDGVSWVDKPAYAQFSAEREVPAGRHNFKVWGGVADGLLDDCDAGFEAGCRYTVALAPRPRGGLGLLRLVERPPVAGQARVRYVNLAAAAPAAAVLDGKVIAAAVASGQVTEPVTIPPAEVHAVWRPSGGGAEVAAEPTRVEFGWLCTFYLLGQAAADSKTPLSVLTDRAEAPRP
jgi:hypothetical protein